jgi:hypothetical protein
MKNYAHSAMALPKLSSLFNNADACYPAVLIAHAAAIAIN